MGCSRSDNPGQTPQFTTREDRFQPASSMRPRSSKMRTPFRLSKEDRRFQYAASVFTLYSSVLFRPDTPAILFQRRCITLIATFSRWIGWMRATNSTDHHTLRGFIINGSMLPSERPHWLFPVDANSNQTSDIPLRIVEYSGKYGTSMDSICR